MGKVVGVIGDPNTGKSVLTYLLYNYYITNTDRRVFRQEGDPSAPTSPWYLESGKHELRKKIKSPWDEKKVQWVVTSLKGLKKGFDIVFVDLGGGRPPRQRVTPELEKILKEVDEAIILCPSENYEECRRGWKKELKEKAPHIDIKLECMSTLDDVEEIVTPTKCIIPGLDREEAKNPRQTTRRAVKKLALYIG